MISRNTNIKAALRSKQRGFFLNPYRFGGDEAPNPPYVDAMLALSPSAYYRYENSEGSAALDSSGNERHGAYVGGCNSSAPGLLSVGSERAFRPSATQYHTAPNAVYAGGAGFSIAFFIRYTTLDNTVVLERGASNNISIQTLSGAFANDLAGAIGLICLNASYNHAYIAVRSGQPIADGQVHHVVFSVGETLASYYCVVDGVDVSYRGIYFAPTADAGNWQIGSRSGAYGFGGAIDELAFIPRAITVAEAQALYAARNQPMN